MSTDTELETWQQEWREQTEPLPELKKKIQRQDQRTVAAIIGVCLCLSVSLLLALFRHSWFWAGAACGIGFSGLLLGAYGWRVRRGTWRPSAQTTLAYAELSYHRAVAKARILRFSVYFLLITFVIFASLVISDWQSFSLRGAAIVAALAIESVVLKRQERRKRQEVVETRKLLDDLNS